MCLYVCGIISPAAANNSNTNTLYILKDNTMLIFTALYILIKYPALSHAISQLIITLYVCVILQVSDSSIPYEESAFLNAASVW